MNVWVTCRVKDHRKKMIILVKLKKLAKTKAAFYHKIFVSFEKRIIKKEKKKDDTQNVNLN